MNKALIGFLILISLSSCGKLYMVLVLGMKEPKPESIQSIRKYGKKVGYDINNHFFYIDSSKVNEIWKGAFPKAYIYDKQGRLLMHLDCFATGVDDLNLFFKKPKDFTQKVSDTLFILYGRDTILNVAPPFSSLPEMVHSLTDKTEFKESDYYIVYFWSKSFGRINKKIGSLMEKYVKDHPEFNSVFIKINCDYQKDWGYTKRDLKSN